MQIRDPRDLVDSSEEGKAEDFPGKFHYNSGDSLPGEEGPAQMPISRIYLKPESPKEEKEEE